MGSGCVRLCVAMLCLVGCEDDDTVTARDAAMELTTGGVGSQGPSGGGQDASAEAPVDAGMDASATDADVGVMDEDAGMPGEPTLTELVQTIFGPTCVQGRCHATSAPAADLSLTGRRISVHDALLAPAVEGGGRARVTPYDPDASYLMEKITSDAPAVGARMPPNGALPAFQVARIRRWIELGAQDN